MTSVVQDEEIDALKAIYDEDFHIAVGAASSFAIHIHSEDRIFSLELNVSLPVDYPQKVPPIYEFKNGDWLGTKEREHVSKNLEAIYRECRGQVVVYQWVEWLREYVESKQGDRKEETLPDLESELTSGSPITDFTWKPAKELPASSAGGEGGARLEIVHGEPLTDRKSTFQAHVARVGSIEEVAVMLTQLKSSKKIAAATHNILAYRIYVESRGEYRQDCDDDGESAAGGRLLHLLQIMKVQDAAVVVTRWYGGIQLHADRFKHINNVARILLQESGIGLQHLNAKASHDKELPNKKKRTKLKTRTP